MLRFLKAWLGLNPDLPFYWDVPLPMHGQEAKNHLSQKVIFDSEEMNAATGKPGKWVMAGHFAGRPPPTIS